jgi:hypothetical protein
VEFNELRAINGGIYIGNVDPVIVDFGGMAETFMDISLPLLETISGGIDIKGRASRYRGPYSWTPHTPLPATSKRVSSSL